MASRLLLAFCLALSSQAAELVHPLNFSNVVFWATAEHKNVALPLIHNAVNSYPAMDCGAKTLLPVKDAASAVVVWKLNGKWTVTTNGVSNGMLELRGQVAEIVAVRNITGMGVAKIAAHLHNKYALP